MDILTAMKFGTTKVINARNGKPWQHFYRISLKEFNTSPGLMILVQEMAMDPHTVQNAMSEAESNETPNKTLETMGQTKRKQSDLTPNKENENKLAAENDKSRESIGGVKVVGRGGIPTIVSHERIDNIVLQSFNPKTIPKPRGSLANLFQDESTEDSDLEHNEQDILYVSETSSEDERNTSSHQNQQLPGKK